MAGTKRPSEVRVRDPLSEVTRRERTTLLGVSAIGIIIAKSGLVPSKISALGIDFDRADQTAILRMLSGVAVYFLVAFVIYASSDLIAWRGAFHDALQESFQRREAQREEPQVTRRDPFEVRRRFWATATRPMSVIRAVFEFLFPVVLGAYAVHALATTPPPKNVLTAPGAPSPSISQPAAGAAPAPPEHDNRPPAK